MQAPGQRAATRALPRHRGAFPAERGTPGAESGGGTFRERPRPPVSEDSQNPGVTTGVLGPRAGVTHMKQVQAIGSWRDSPCLGVINYKDNATDPRGAVWGPNEPENMRRAVTGHVVCGEGGTAAAHHTTPVVVPGTERPGSRQRLGESPPPLELRVSVCGEAVGPHDSLGGLGPQALPSGFRACRLPTVTRDKDAKMDLVALRDFCFCFFLSFLLLK